MLYLHVCNFDTYTEVTIEDDGVGIDEGKLQQILERKAGQQSGVGLINTNQRLNRHFGSGLSIESTLGESTKISFRVPYSKQ